MSYIAYSSTRGLLTSESELTDYISSSHIRVGYTTDTIYMPSITIHQAGGSTWGYLGYGNSSVGNKLRRDESIIQLDIFHRWNLLSSQRIGDIIDKTLISDGWYRKTNDIDTYSNDLQCYNKKQVWVYKQNVQD